MKRLLEYYGLELPIEFVPAARTTWQSGPLLRPVRLLVLHSAECGEVVTAAEALAKWAAGAQHPKGASWHFAVDCDSITQSVECHDIAWHAGPVNTYSIGIEQAGRASQTAEQWADEYSNATLKRTAQLLAVLAGMYEIPLEHASNLRSESTRGVCTHADVTREWKTKGGHTDPGPSYPLEEVLRMARAYQLEAVSS